MLGTPCPLHTAIWKRVFAVLLTVLVSKTGQNLKFSYFLSVFTLIFPNLRGKLNIQLIEVHIQLSYL